MGSVPQAEVQGVGHGVGEHAIAGTILCHALRWVSSFCAHPRLGKWQHSSHLTAEEAEREKWWKHLRLPECLLATECVWPWLPESFFPLPPSCSLWLTCTHSFTVSIRSFSSPPCASFLSSTGHYLTKYFLWFADCGGLFQRGLQKWILKAYRFQYFRLRWSPQSWLPWRPESRRRRAPEPAYPFLQREGHVVTGIQVDVGPWLCFVSMWGENKLSFC